jgi:hypothetical protein
LSIREARAAAAAIANREIGMKTVIAMTVLALAATAALARGWDDDFVPREPVVKQSGHYEWQWDGDDSLGIQAPVSVRYTPAGPPRIVATGPDELLAHLQVGQGRIRVDRDWHYSGRDRVQVTVTGVTVHNIALSGSGQADLAKLDLDRLNLAISGSGSVRGDGRSDTVNLAVSGSGNADLAKLETRSANVHISGSGRVDLTPRDSANIATSGSGIVRMAKRPAHLTQHISGSGGARIGNE